MSIGENIKKLRESHGLTQSQLGDIAGVSDKAVSTWESGLREPRMGAVEKLHSTSVSAKVIFFSAMTTTFIVFPVGGALLRTLLMPSLKTHPLPMLSHR